MATIPTRFSSSETDYPTSDGRPIAETDLHRDLMVALIQSLEAWFADNPQVYVSGNLLLHYVPGDRRTHLSPDVFVVRGVPKRKRKYYLTWEEGKGPDVVIELTSSSTRDEDVEDKYWLYEQQLRVPEYFLFDPNLDYLDPPLQGHRLHGEKYQPIEPVEGRLPSDVLGLHLEQHGDQLRLYDPVARQLLPTLDERVARTESALQKSENARRVMEQENERLRQELEQARRADRKS